LITKLVAEKLCEAVCNCLGLLQKHVMRFCHGMFFYCKCNAAVLC